LPGRRANAVTFRFRDEGRDDAGSVFFPRSRAGKNEWPLIMYELSLSSLRDGQYILQLVAETHDDSRAIGDGNRGGFPTPI